MATENGRGRRKNISWHGGGHGRNKENKEDNVYSQPITHKYIQTLTKVTLLDPTSTKGQSIRPIQVSRQHIGMHRVPAVYVPAGSSPLSFSRSLIGWFLVLSLFSRHIRFLSTRWKGCMSMKKLEKK